jgi:hypothetical protein
MFHLPSMCSFSHLKRDNVTRFSTFGFFHESVSPKPLSIPPGPFRIFSKIAEIFAAQGGKWKKSSIIKVLIILIGHLGEVELTYRYIFAFKLTLRSHWYCTFTCENLRKFSKKSKRSIEILWGWEKTDSWIKPEEKNLVTLSLYHNFAIISCRIYFFCSFYNKNWCKNRWKII